MFSNLARRLANYANIVVANWQDIPKTREQLSPTTKVVGKFLNVLANLKITHHL